MPKFLVTYTFRYYGDAQFSRTFHEQDEPLTEADILTLEEAIRKDPTAGVPKDSLVQVLAVSELAADRPEPEKPRPRKGCAVVLVLAAVAAVGFRLARDG
jgi:hypothetical protein